MFKSIKKRLGVLTLGCSLAVVGPAAAQTTGYVTPGAVDTMSQSSAFCSAQDECIPGVWINVDYLLWWTKSAPGPGPLVTTGPLTDLQPGFLGQPNTRVVFGDESVSNNPFHGIRLEAGTWIDEARTVGFEASVFTFEHRTNIQDIASDAGGNPVLARPFIDANTGLNSGVYTAFPGDLAGVVNVANSTRVTSWDANMLFNVFDDGMTRADFLVGMRGIYLYEYLNVSENFLALADQGPGNPNALVAGERGGTADRFNTKNNFYGGQLGGRLSHVTPTWIVSATAKVALGVTDQIADLEGQSTTRGADNIAAGVFVNDANSGRYYRGAFSIVPQLDLNLGYRIHPNIVLRGGYSFLYWNAVARPGNVVNNVVNPNLVPSIVPGGVPGATQPRNQIDSSDFWATGFNLGVEFRF